MCFFVFNEELCEWQNHLRKWFKSGRPRSGGKKKNQSLKFPHTDLEFACPSSKCRCQVGIWIFKSSSDGRIWAGDMYWKNLST